MVETSGVAEISVDNSDVATVVASSEKLNDLKAGKKIDLFFVQKGLPVKMVSFDPHVFARTDIMSGTLSHDASEGSSHRPRVTMKTMMTAS